jgi:hypothetical protein
MGHDIGGLIRFEGLCGMNFRKEEKMVDDGSEEVCGVEGSAMV